MKAYTSFSHAMNLLIAGVAVSCSFGSHTSQFYYRHHRNKLQYYSTARQFRDDEEEINIKKEIKANKDSSLYVNYE